MLKNAFLIITNTPNNTFDFTFISGHNSSLNMISINDYNRNLSGDTFFQNLETDENFSIVNSVALCRSRAGSTGPCCSSSELML